MGVIACGVESEPYLEMASEERWDRLVEHFREEISRIFQVPFALSYLALNLLIFCLAPGAIGVLCLPADGHLCP